MFQCPWEQVRSWVRVAWLPLEILAFRKGKLRNHTLRANLSKTNSNVNQNKHRISDEWKISPTMGARRLPAVPGAQWE